MKEQIWSVELEGNSWNDDTFNGSYKECVEFCKKYDYEINGRDARLARILVEDDCVVEVLEVVEVL